MEVVIVGVGGGGGRGERNFMLSIKRRIEERRNEDD